MPDIPEPVSEAKKLELARIAEWLDSDLMQQIAAEYPEATPNADRLRDKLVGIIDSVDRLLNPKNTTEGDAETKRYLDKIGALAAAAAHVIEMLEDVGEFGKMSGPTKKGVATAAVMAIYDAHREYLRIPWLPAGGAIERGVLRFMCDYGIEIGVAVWNIFKK